MFDIGFSEVLLIFVIALVVLGPEKLPRLASQVGRWIGRARAMARQFKEQLEEEVNLEEVRKAREQKPKTTTEDAVSGQQAQEASSAAGSASTSPNATPWEGNTQAEQSSGTDQAGAQSHEDAQQPQASGIHGGGESNYTGPDPADFRADTFSHAHPTNEYGANPLTSNGAAAESTPSTTSHAGDSSASTQTPEDAGAHGASPAQSQFPFDSRTPSEANVAAAQPQAEAGSEQRPAPDEGYAARRPRDNTPGTDNHGN